LASSLAISTVFEPRTRTRLNSCLGLPPAEVASVMSDANPKLRVRNLRKTYGPVTALKGASLELSEGEFLTLLGPSGSGKTTLLMAVAGLTEPDEGEIWIDGKLATRTPPFLRDIGMVFQNYALFPHMTVFENIAFPLEMRGRSGSDIARAVDDALEVVQLAGYGRRYPRELSGGQQQRVALARCFVYRPSIILMDEPLGALDKKLREQMQLEIKQLHTRLGVSVLYVTHDQEEALTLSDTVCLMNGGSIEQMGAPAELYFRPANAFVADFLGSPNILSGVVTRMGPAVEVALGGNASIRAPHRPGLSAGQVIKVMIRPEAIALLGGRDCAENVLRGSVQDIIMMGAVTRYLVATETGDIVSVAKLTTDATRMVEAGSPITLGWPIGSTVLLPERGSQAP
jgi:putative spermidine/putrescine transport system ATP-binding protein